MHFANTGEPAVPPAARADDAADTRRAPSFGARGSMWRECIKWPRPMDEVDLCSEVPVLRSPSSGGPPGVGRAPILPVL